MSVQAAARGLAAAAGYGPSEDPPRIGERALCGIAGYSLSGGSRVDQTLATQTLLAAIAERGSDAVGYAYRGPGLPLRCTSSAAARARSSTGSKCPRRPARRSSTCATTRRATPASPPTTTRSGTGRWSASTTGSSPTTRRSSSGHGFERAEPGMTVDSEAIFALADEASSAPGRPRGAARLHGGGLARRARRRRPSSSPAASAGRSGSGRAATSSSSPRPARRSSSWSATPASACASASSARGRSSRSWTAACGTRVLRARPQLRRGLPPPPVRAPEEARSCLARLAAIATAAAGSGPLALPSPAACSRAARKAAHPPRPGRRAGRPATPRAARAGPRAPSQSVNEAPGRARARRPRPARAPAPVALGVGDVEARLPERVRERAEPVPVERLRREPRAALVEVAPRRARPSSAPRARSWAGAPRSSRSGAGRGPPRRLAAFQVPKRSTTVCGWTARGGSAGELAHRRRATEPSLRRPRAPRGSGRRSSGARAGLAPV